ncbi:MULTISPECIES: hypothetical protein [unclassified Nocardioides]|nr:hypothetical protein [Nocardioides sp. URHA0032]
MRPDIHGTKGWFASSRSGAPAWVPQVIDVVICPVLDPKNA